MTVAWALDFTGGAGVIVMLIATWRHEHRRLRRPCLRARPLRPEEMTGHEVPE